jgi:predicted house-cleaning noncanonical NTP pyrophosphatase (MazG superfamily)
MPVYNKLVRDRIPEIIEKSGKQFSIKSLDESDYIKELKQKLKEEMKEYLKSETNQEATEELADILEVIYALAQTHHTSPDQLEAVRKEKAEKRGGFQEKFFLIQVDDE